MRVRRRCPRSHDPDVQIGPELGVRARDHLFGARQVQTPLAVAAGRRRYSPCRIGIAHRRSRRATRTAPSVIVTVPGDDGSCPSATRSRPHRVPAGQRARSRDRRDPQRERLGAAGWRGTSAAAPRPSARSGGRGLRRSRAPAAARSSRIASSRSPSTTRPAVRPAPQMRSHRPPNTSRSSASDGEDSGRRPTTVAPASSSSSILRRAPPPSCACSTRREEAVGSPRRPTGCGRPPHAGSRRARPRPRSRSRTPPGPPCRGRRRTGR